MGTMEKSRNKMKTLKYKGYLGSIEFSAEDNLLFGEILGIDGLVNYEGKTMQELTKSFHEAVEDYLAFCTDHGLKPQKSFSGMFNVRIAPDTHRNIANMAAEAGISINAYVRKALDEAVSYDSRCLEPTMLMEPEGPAYGSGNVVTFQIPERDLAFARELASRLDWVEV